MTSISPFIYKTIHQKVIFKNFDQDLDKRTVGPVHLQLFRPSVIRGPCSRLHHVSCSLLNNPQTTRLASFDYISIGVFNIFSESKNFSMIKDFLPLAHEGEKNNVIKATLAKHTVILEFITSKNKHFLILPSSLQPKTT